MTAGIASPKRETKRKANDIVEYTTVVLVQRPKSVMGPRSHNNPPASTTTANASQTSTISISESLSIGPSLLRTSAKHSRACVNPPVLIFPTATHIAAKDAQEARQPIKYPALVISPAFRSIKFRLSVPSENQ